MTQKQKKEEKNQLPRLTREEIEVTRNADGEVEPVEVPLVRMSASMLMRPATIGSLHKVKEHLSKPTVEWPIEAKVQLLNDHVVDPDLSDLTVERAERSWDSWTLDEMVDAVALYSGPLRRQLRGEKKEKGKATGR